MPRSRRRWALRHRKRCSRGIYRNVGYHVYESELYSYFFVAAAVCACSELVGFLELQYEICKRFDLFHVWRQSK